MFAESVFYFIKDHFFYSYSSVLITEKRQMSLGQSILLGRDVYGNVSVLLLTSFLLGKPLIFILSYPVSNKKKITMASLTTRETLEVF